MNLTLFLWGSIHLWNGNVQRRILCLILDKTLVEVKAILQAIGEKHKAHIPPETGFALATKRKGNQHKKHEMYMPNASPNARHPTPPIFHWELGLRLLPNAKKSIQKKRNVHGRRKKLASPNAKDTNMLVSLR